MIRSLYERLFVEFYGWSLKVDGQAGSYTTFYACLSLSLGVFLNIASLALLLEMLFSWPLSAQIRQHSVLWVIAFSVVIAVLNYGYFTTGRRYKKLISTYAGSEKSLATSSSRAVVTYMVLSFTIFVALLFLLTSRYR